MTVEAHITIDRDKSAVWAAITNIRHAADIISSVENIEILHEPETGLVGLKWRETRMYFGKPAAIDKCITDAVENKYYTSRAEMDGFIFLTTMTISESGEHVLLTSTHDSRSQGILAKIKSLPMIFFKGMLKKAIQKDLEDIKIAIEKQFQ